MRILVVEDDAEAATAMVRGLTEAGHEPTHAVDGAFGLLEAQKGGYDVYVVDRMMPRLDGIGMVETLRKDGDQTPVLFLVKPYAFSELIARVEALSRRRETGSVATMLKVGDLEMNLISRSVHRAGQEIDLQPREFQLLEFLMRHAGQSVTRTMLLEKVWEYHFDPQTNVIDVHISRLRAKIDKGFDHAMLQTVRGAGYRLEPPSFAARPSG
ncbi:response regulator transcription factor [Brevundimonas sp. Root1423]|uniref:response regulator transcription factor n=1 Tax=Brevundimonas sp. Root1423 TaxID=1736462 RepID=UPI0006FD3A5C|nr:response regulator transcription factor [Brevundimonas sp. Root1423]KQY80408.1 XRE family transcriptional regulator [Brevundimonas sp. Root1423]